MIFGPVGIEALQWCVQVWYYSKALSSFKIISVHQVCRELPKK